MQEFDQGVGSLSAHLSASWSAIAENIRRVRKQLMLGLIYFPLVWRGQVAVGGEKLLVWSIKFSSVG